MRGGSQEMQDKWLEGSTVTSLCCAAFSLGSSSDYVQVPTCDGFGEEVAAGVLRITGRELQRMGCAH